MNMVANIDSAVNTQKLNDFVFKSEIINVSNNLNKDMNLVDFSSNLTFSLAVHTSL